MKRMFLVFMILGYVSVCFDLCSMGEVLGSTYYSQIADWAEVEVSEAGEEGLIPDLLLGTDFTAKATREELCEITVRLYEKLSGSPATPYQPNPFTDTTNVNVLKAYNLGITSGVGEGLFAPDAYATREQVATMYSRMFHLLYPQEKEGDGITAFSDDLSISSWAKVHVSYMSDIGLLKGASGNFMPRPLTEEEKSADYGMVRRQEAVIIARRGYGHFLGGTVAVDQPLQALTEDHPEETVEYFSAPSFSIVSDGFAQKNEFGLVYEEADVFRPVYYSAVTLSVPKGYDDNGTSQYTSSPFSGYVSRLKEGGYTFKVSLAQSVREKATAIRWQISTIPFDGRPIGALSITPPKLVTSGVLSPWDKSFNVDLRHYGLAERGTVLLYVRAYPVDMRGSIGDTGKGLGFYYGDPPMASTENTTAGVMEEGLYLSVSDDPLIVAHQPDSGPLGLDIKIVEPQPIRPVIVPVEEEKPLLTLVPTLMPATPQGEYSSRGEYPSSFMDVNNFNHYADSSSQHHFMPGFIPSGTQEVRVQVSKVPFDELSEVGSSAMLYEKVFFPDEKIYRDFLDGEGSGFALDFNEWAPSSEDMGDQVLVYYIRYLAYIEDKGSFYQARASETVAMSYYNYVDDITWYTPPEPVGIDMHAAVIEEVVYTAPRLEREGWQYRYVVFKEPTGIWKDHYDIGDKLDFTPKEDTDNNWLQEAWDAVTEFFSDLAGYAADLVNWTSSSYADMKQKMVAYAVSTIPVPSSWKGPLEVAVGAVVDAGMVSIGLPPSLPNFDELTEQGADYLVTAAMEEAGIPESVVSEAERKLIADKLIEQSKASASKAHPNPMVWDFIKLDPDYLYQPALIMVTVKNPSTADQPSNPGWLESKVTYEMTYEERTSPVYSDQYLEIILGTPNFHLYQPFSVYVPSLEPGESLDIPVYYQLMVGETMPGGNAHVVTYDDFLHLYGYIYDFGVSIRYDLPSIEEAAKALPDYDPYTGYYYTSPGGTTTIHVTSDPDEDWGW